MRGRLVEWNDERGFGFILAENQHRYFIHISDIGRIAGRPCIGDALRFLPSRAPDGRPRAVAARIDKPDPLLPAHRADWRLVAAVLLIAGVAAASLRSGASSWLALPYLVMGVITVLAYRADKRAAAAGRWRVSEAQLHGLDLCFGIVGGLLAQTLLRHKTRKPYFVAITVAIVLIHAVLIGGLLGVETLAGEGFRWPGPGG